MAIGDLISAQDYNLIRNKIIGILGPGAGQSGYGQPIQSSAVSQSDVITALQWNSLRADIFNTIVHQSNSLPSIFTPVVNNLIRFGSEFPVTQYDTFADQAIANKFAIGDDQFAIEGGTPTTGVSVSRTLAWSNSVTCVVTVNFANANEARYFFNSGGLIRLSSSRSGGASTAQNTSWTNLLNSAGTREFGAVTSGVNFYNLTNVNQVWYSTASSAPYAANNYVIEVRSNVANNSGGTASQLTFTITWTDGYVDPGEPAPGDVIDGTLSLTVTQRRAVGNLYNAAGQIYSQFTIAGPSQYTATAITGT
jgi:hypothetical protein